MASLNSMAAFISASAWFLLNLLKSSHCWSVVELWRRGDRGVAGCGLQGTEEGLTEILLLLFGDSCGVNLQRDVWGSEVEREAAPVDIQCLHFVPVVRIELLPDFLQEAGEENCIGTISPPPPRVPGCSPL